MEDCRSLRSRYPHPSGSPPDGGQSPQNFFQFFRGRAQKSFSIKKRNFAGFVSLLTQGRAASHPHRAFGAEAVGQKFPPPPTPFLFARLLEVRGGFCYSID